MNLLGYIKKQQATFDEQELNIIDILAFSWISYYDYITYENKFPIRIEDLASDPYYQTLTPYADCTFVRRGRNIMRAMFISNRFKDVEILDFAMIYSRHTVAQTAALAVRVKDKIIITFKGTDTSFVGWREDFVLSFKGSITSYNFAKKFYENIINKYDEPVILAGHSKGGNIATYLLSSLDNVDRIYKVISYDGPGFKDEIFKGKEDRIEKFIKVVPKSSLVGVLFSNETEVKIIKSYSISVFQHMPLDWNIKNNDFIYIKKRSLSGRYLEKVINNWIDSLTEEEREKYTNILFDSLDSLKTDDFQKLVFAMPKHVKPFVKSYTKLSKEDKKLVNKVARKLIKSFMLLNKGKKELEKSKSKKKSKSLG